MKIEKELVSEETMEQGLNVTLRVNTLDKEGSYYASVNSRVASVKSALRNIKSEDKGVDITSVKHGLELYNNQVISLLSQGFSVKVLDLGVLVIKRRGRVKDRNEAESISGFTVEFIPGNDVLKAVENLSVDAVLTVDNSPVMESVTDLSRRESDGTVTIGQPMQVLGRNLKVNVEDDELYFVPQTEDGEPVADKERWIRVENDQIFRNKPTELNLFVPGTLTTGTKYRLLVKSSYISGSRARKTALTGTSDVFTAESSAV